MKRQIVKSKREDRSEPKPHVAAKGLDPYARLGVARDATTEQVKKAFRKLAMKEHPDQGGDRETFEELQVCYDTLIDPERRRFFDLTGELKEQKPDNTQSDAYGRIAAVFKQTLAELKERKAIPEQVDILRVMRKRFADDAKARANQRREIKEHIPLWEAFRGRFSAKRGKKNFIADVINETISTMTKSLSEIDRWDAADKVALELMDDFDYKWDRPERQEGPVYAMPVGFGFGGLG